MTLSALELAKMRATADEHLPDGVIVTRPTFASDGQGGSLPTYTPVYNGPGRVAPVNSIAGAESVVAERLGGAQGLWITVPHHVTVLLRDRVLWGSQTFEVVGEDTPRSWGISSRILCREIT